MVLVMKQGQCLERSELQNRIRKYSQSPLYASYEFTYLQWTEWLLISMPLLSIVQIPSQGFYDTLQTCWIFSYPGMGCYNCARDIQVHEVQEDRKQDNTQAWFNPFCLVSSQSTSRAMANGVALTITHAQSPTSMSAEGQKLNFVMNCPSSSPPLPAGTPTLETSSCFDIPGWKVCPPQMCLMLRHGLLAACTQSHLLRWHSAQIERGM